MSEKEKILEAKKIYILDNLISRYVAANTETALTVTQQRVLRFILKGYEEGLYQRDVEKEFKIRKSTVTGILQLMEEKGYIRRERVTKDLRLKRLIPTEKALNLRGNVNACMEELDKVMTAKVDKKDLAVCSAVLDQMLESLSEFLGDTMEATR